MEKGTKIAKFVLWGLFAISIVLFILLLTSIETQENPGAKAESLITFSIYWSEILIAIGAFVALFYAAKQMVADKKTSNNITFDHSSIRFDRGYIICCFIE